MRNVSCTKPTFSYGNKKGFGITVQIVNAMKNIYKQYKVNHFRGSFATMSTYVRGSGKGEYAVKFIALSFNSCACRRMRPENCRNKTPSLV